VHNRSAVPDLKPEDIHALSNHLAVILGFVELLLEDAPAGSARRNDLLEIRAAAVEAARILGKRPSTPDESS
jgi:hypothetical protein